MKWSEAGRTGSPGRAAGGDLWPCWDDAAPPKVAGVATAYISTACRIGDHHDCQDHPVVLCACVCHDDERRESVRIPLRPLNRDEFAGP